MSIDTTEVTCPSCGTVSHYEELTRDGAMFCRTCDYPLFWARAPRQEGGVADVADGGLRRLPGTGGRVTLATIACPVCTEPNSASANICIRCGADLHAKPAPPVVLLPPAPLTEPVPVPAGRSLLWWWVALAVLLVLGVVALVVVLA